MPMDINELVTKGDDSRVEDDSFFAAIEAARSHIGARRPSDDEPEDQWQWDKLTRLLAILYQLRG